MLCVGFLSIRLADDGNRFCSDGGFILISSEAKGVGLEDGGLGIGRGGRLVDFPWGCFSMFCPAPFLKALLSRFLVSGKLL